MKLHIERKERLYTRKHVVRYIYGRLANHEYTRRFMQVRWHIVDERGQCQAPGICGAKDQGACGWYRLREAKARLAKFAA